MTCPAALGCSLSLAPACTLLSWERVDGFRPTHRPSLHADIGVSLVEQVTGLCELYYPWWKRALKYVVSAVVTLFMLGVAFVVMVCSLNVQVRSTSGCCHACTALCSSTVGA